VVLSREKSASLPAASCVPSHTESANLPQSNERIKMTVFAIGIMLDFAAMNPEEQMNRLCARIQIEEDHHLFTNCGTAKPTSAAQREASGS
jgi:hypothetical protein